MILESSPYSLMFLNNEIQNEQTTVDHRGGAIFPSSTSHEHILSQAKIAINRNWLLIENQSTVHVIYNPKLLNSIQRSERTMHIFYNAGVNTTDMFGDMPGVGGDLVPLRRHGKYPIHGTDLERLASDI